MRVEARRPSEPPRAAQTRSTVRSLQPAPVPSFQLIRKREEEPSERSPIAYREYAYVVDRDTARESAELLLWARFKEIASSLSERAAGKFVRLAVFDHTFDKRPSRPPIATLTWKDWRGEPVIQFPDQTERPPSSRPSAPRSFPPPAVKPAPLPPFFAPQSSAVAAAPAAPEPGAPMPMPQAATAPSPSSKLAQAAPAPEPGFASPPPIAPSSGREFAAAPIAAPQGSVALSPALAASSPASAPVAAPARAVAAGPDGSVERPRRRRSSDDLIGDLFETMHDLRFIVDVVSGAQFVLGVLGATFAVEAIVVHIFDINTNHFVVVRAKGPNARDVLLMRTSDRDPLYDEIMHRARALAISDAVADGRLAGKLWQTLGVNVRSALCGAVRQGGRYLGLIELANPDGGGAFYPTEINALDYICERFAEFLANRPIVVDAEVVLPKD